MIREDRSWLPLRGVIRAVWLAERRAAPVTNSLETEFAFTESADWFIYWLIGGRVVSRIDDAFVEWVGRCVLPWEAHVRAWLRRASVPACEIDDIVQEAYSRIARLENFRHISNPRSYFLEVARNLLFEQLRRSQIIRIDTIAEMDLPVMVDESPDQERVAIGRAEVARLKRLVDALPERCREMFVLRKIEGLSQKQIAARLGVSENTVETQVGRGLRLILRTWTDETSEQDGRKKDQQRISRRRKRD